VAHVAQPVHRRYRRAAPRGGVRRRHRLGSDVAADDGADAARRAAEPGHVPGRIVPDVPGAAHRDRGVHLRPGAGGPRPAHPPRRRGQQVTTPPSESAPLDGRSGMGAARTPIPHQVSTDPFDPYSVEQMSAEQERYYMASQWRMMWWKFL